MIGPALIKQLKSYQQKKFRAQDGVFVAETPKVAEVLLQSPIVIEKILAVDAWWADKKNQSLLAQWERKNKRQAEKIEVSDKELERISGLECAQEVWFLCRKPDTSLPAPAVLAQGTSLLLDELRDPGNLGTILRLADWFGIDRILCTEGCADAYQPKCVQASMGSAAVIPVHVAPRTELLAIMKQENIHLYGTFMQGENIYASDLKSDKAWYIIGNEAHGIAADFEKAVHTRLTIPSSPKHDAGGAQSLNAAMATAILCSEISRRRL